MQASRPAASRPSTLLAVLIGGFLVWTTSVSSPQQSLADDGGIASSLGLAGASQPHDYVFLPNRYSVWVIHQATGRFANFTIRDAKATLKSSTGTINRTRFPIEETVLKLSDRNMTSALWVGNSRTGDFELWRIRGDGKLHKAELVRAGIELAPTLPTTTAPAP